MRTNGTKQLISLRISGNVLDWFKKSGSRGYQSRIHSVLENYVHAQQGLAERKAGRAQELFRANYARCFWHLDQSLEITPDNIQIVVDGLKKYGGREGLILAEELCQ